MQCNLSHVSVIRRKRQYYAINLHCTHDTNKFRIEGNTDSVGSKLYNKDLSIDRANSMARYLENQNIEEDRLRTLGLGETDPVAQNFTAHDRHKII